MGDVAGDVSMLTVRVRAAMRSRINGLPISTADDVVKPLTHPWNERDGVRDNVLTRGDPLPKRGAA